MDPRYILPFWSTPYNIKSSELYYTSNASAVVVTVPVTATITDMMMAITPTTIPMTDRTIEALPRERADCCSRLAFPCATTARKPTTEQHAVHLQTLNLSFMGAIQ